MVPLPAHAETAPESQCTGSEVKIFFCPIGDKNLSVCQLGDPEITIDSVAKPSSRPYPGGGETRLRFSRGAYDYLVYDLIRYSGVADEETGMREMEDRAGVHVLKDDKRIATLSCTGGGDIDSGNDLTGKLKSKQEEDFVDLD
jgi:hypothetical protein